MWELSVKASVGAKADEDYNKRLTTPDGSPTTDCTYVAAYLRRWTKRKQWVQDKSSDQRWKEIKAYGLDDIEAWIESAPVTWAWISERLGLHPYGLRSAEIWWDTWSAQTAPALPAELILAGRETELSALQNRLSHQGQVITTTGPSVDEVRAFVVAAGRNAADGTDPGLFARMALVDELATWRQLIDAKNPLVLIPMEERFASEVPPHSIHSVIVPVSHREKADIELSPLNANAAKQALMNMGFDEKRADETSRLGRRSLMALRRSLATKPALHIPNWASTQASRSERAALLAGSWSERLSGDQDVLQDFAGGPYENLRDQLRSLADTADPLVINVGDSWHLVSPLDAWLLLKRYVTPDDLSRLEKACQRVLGEIDPALGLAMSDRWKAGMEGRVRAFSSDLRKGLAETLALLGTHGEGLRASGGADGADWARFLVRQLLEKANADESGHQWASVADLLPLLAEAAPLAFLEAVRVGVTGDDPVLLRLFTDQEQDDAFSAHSFHTGLLWALENTAWSSDHFGASIDLLARLDALDPGGRLSNRPMNSIVEIFCPWHPETSVSPDRRLGVLDSLRDRHPQCAWKLMKTMLPKAHGVHMPTHEPQFRDWKPVQAPPILMKDYVSFLIEVANRAIEEAGQDAERWAALLRRLPDLPPGARTAFYEKLKSRLDEGNFREPERQYVWKELRQTIGHHKDYADAKWALPADEIASLEELAAACKPSNAIDASLWLFEDHSPALGDITRRDDYEAYESALATARRQAISEVDAQGGLEHVRKLAVEGKVPWAVGSELARSVEAKYEEDLAAWLTDDASPELELANSYFGQRFQKGGWAWLDQFLANHSELTAVQLASLYLCVRDFPAVWDRVSDAGGEVPAKYWARFRAYGLGQDFAFLERVVAELMKVDRNAAALDLLGMYMHDKAYADNPALVPLAVTALKGLLNKGGDPEMRLLSSHDFETLFAYLESHADQVGADELASLEWNFLPALGFDPNVPTLHRRMASTPAFYVEVLSTVFKRRSGEHEDADPDEQKNREALATNGYRLLSSWTMPPGATGQSFDLEEFRRWYQTAEPLLREADRYEIGMSHLGHALVGVAPEADEWPPKPVRDLIEELQSDELDEGFLIQVLNSRGVTSRGLEEGGAQERGLVSKYGEYAEKFADRWPRTAAILREVAERYEWDARRNEESAERFRHGLGF